jgi:hypothetical protein
MPEIGVVHVTHRPRPRFDWFVDAFARQLADGDSVEVVFVDGLHSRERSNELHELIRGRFRWRHVPAKPTPWNGPHRLTRAEYFAPASARNTGIVYARSPYLVFVDDCALPMPGWWDEAKAAARHGYVVAGAYQKHEEMVVEDGELAGSRLAAEGRDVRDFRWDTGDDEALVEVGGGDLYGCSFGAPRKLLVEVNGLDELCDPIGWSDCSLGLRLQRAGATIFYSRQMLTVESMDQYRQEPKLLKLTRTLEPEAYMQRLRELGAPERAGGHEWSNMGMVVDLTHAATTIRSLGNPYDLATLGEAALPATVDQFEERYWFDGVPLADLDGGGA